MNELARHGLTWVVLFAAGCGSTRTVTAIDDTAMPARVEKTLTLGQPGARYEAELRYPPGDDRAPTILIDSRLAGCRDALLRFASREGYVTLHGVGAMPGNWYRVALRVLAEHPRVDEQRLFLATEHRERLAALAMWCVDHTDVPFPRGFVLLDGEAGTSDELDPTLGSNADDAWRRAHYPIENSEFRGIPTYPLADPERGLPGLRDWLVRQAERHP